MNTNRADLKGAGLDRFVSTPGPALLRQITWEEPAAHTPFPRMSRA
jgi:hypothetical protein